MQMFGECDGVPVIEVEIVSRSGACAKVISWGATVRDLLVPHGGKLQRVVTGLNTLADYQNHSTHMGAIAGRFANRIAKASFTLDGTRYNLPQNAGVNSLHGGGRGFGKRPWKVMEHNKNSVTLKLVSQAGDMGYPGQMEVICIYALLEPATLRIDLLATTDAPTIINLAHHSYFNLDGSSDILEHEVTIPSRLRTPTDEDLIPTGEIIKVAGTPWDFSTPQKIGARGVKYDGNYIIDAMADVDSKMAFAAKARSLKNGLAMEVWTSEPCVQFYDAAKMNCPVPGLDGVHYGAHAGLCFEPQVMPNSPNERHFTNCVLRPEQEYRQMTEYRFG